MHLVVCHYCHYSTKIPSFQVSLLRQWYVHSKPLNPALKESLLISSSAWQNFQLPAGIDFLTNTFLHRWYLPAIKIHVYFWTDGLTVKKHVISGLMDWLSKNIFFWVDGLTVKKVFFLGWWTDCQKLLFLDWWTDWFFLWKSLNFCVFFFV